jgi:hypothetical protein
MYGLVNKAIAGLVCDRFGIESWMTIKAKAGIDVDIFISMDAYDDNISFKLVDAASEVLGIPTDHVLETFGEYWVLYTAKEGYGPMLQMAGNNLLTFLQNLDHLHAHVGFSLPQLRPPSFWCTDVTAQTIRLHYASGRIGLAPMVIGLLKGLGKRFNEAIEIEHVQRHDQGASHDEFLIHINTK